MADRKSGHQKKREWKAKFDYPVDYNDHFETPLIAYQDILPILDAVQEDNKNRKEHVVYDPYYCDGRTAIFLRQLGFEQVVHAKRDFYRDISNHKIPQHDTLVTNPPYSDTHKERCLEFCAQQFRDHKRPFFLLMPNYVAARSYYRRILGDLVDDVAYFVPSQPYEYDHPEGTGHEIPPFASLWFCGIGKETIHRFQTKTREPQFVKSLEELQARKVIPTEKRPNPRQRKKRTAAALGGENATTPVLAASRFSSKSAPSGPAVKKKSISKQSVYRDERGKRIRKRF